MRGSLRGVMGIGLSLAAACVQAAELRDLRLWDGPDATRVVLDLDTQASYRMFTLEHPDRLVVDVAGTRRASALKLGPTLKGVVRNVRSGPHEGGLRVVLDLAAPVDPQAFGMQASGDYGYRLILDLVPHGVAARSPAAAPALVTAQMTTQAAEPSAPVEAAPVEAPPARREAPVVAATPANAGESLQLAAKPIVVAVDAGHGGEDPGTIGHAGVQEKDVTLAIARRLARRIDAQPGMRAVLTRDGDYFVELRQRTVKARQAQADLFVSIHCNSYKDRDMRGTAVYVLSDRGASSEQARWLANHENAADLVGGVHLQNKDDGLAAVLIDISQSATMDASFDLGARLLDSIGGVNALQKPVVQQAGFMVLKSPDIPSVLVETAFLSNPAEERLLASAGYQEKMAGSIFEGIKGYFARYRPLQQVAREERSDRPEMARRHRGKTIPVSLGTH